MSDVTTRNVDSVVVEIGSLPIRLLTDSPAFLSLMQNRYADFLNTDATADIDISFDLVSSGTISSEEEVRVVRNGTQWCAERADFRLDWDAQNSNGTVQQSINPYALDGMLRILHSLVLADRGGFLLHAASAVRNGRAFLFFGPSGSGKTTISRLAPPDSQVLTDEISYVRTKEGTYWAYGTPFSGEMAEPGENISAPIAAVYHLVQAPTNLTRLMKPGDAIRSLLESVLFFAQDPDLVKRVFASVCDLVGTLPVYRLEFVPDQTVWDLIQ